MKFTPYMLAVSLAAALQPSAYAFTAEEAANAQTSGHLLNFDDVELSVLVADVSAVTGYTFILHPDARAKRVTVSSSTPLTREQVFDVFLSTLRVNGFSAAPAGRGTFRIIPEEAAVSESGFKAFAQNGFVTEVIATEFVDPAEAARMIKPIVDAQGQVITNPSSRTLIVVDYASNMARVRDLVERIDRDPSVTEIIPVRNIPATSLATLLTTLAGPPSENGTPSAFRAVASNNGDAVVVYGSAAMVQRARTVSAQLDSNERSRASLRVLALNNADAKEIVPILQQMAIASDARFGRGPDAGPMTTIAHHEATNSLVISAPPETLAELERVVSDLDKRRAQVFVEAIIVEISDDTARELGLQFLLSGREGSAIPFASTNFSRSAPNLLALAGALARDTPFNTGTNRNNPFTQAAVNSLLGTNGFTLGVGSESGNTLFGAVLNAVEKDGSSRILSKPFNMTLDHGTSNLLVGQEVPIATGEVLGDGNTNPFRTVDRKKIGIGLKVTPRISNDDTIRLDIQQEVSNIAGVVGVATPDLIFNTREIQTSVVADNGEIIVLGGLIEQSDTISSDAIPGLGRIPVAGRLFKSEGKAKERTNLMVFIRPTIVRDKASAEAITRRSFRYIEAEELWSAAGRSGTVESFVNATLGQPMPK